MPHNDPSEPLIRRAAGGDSEALNELLQLNRKRLRHMVAIQLDSRLQARIDPSDIVQEAMVEASRRFPDYLTSRPLPFYPWLRQLAMDRIRKVHRNHLGRERRDVRREVPLQPLLPDESVEQLAAQFVQRTSSPSHRLVRRELRAKVREALARLNDDDREVLVLRYLEHLSGAEAAAALGISEAAQRMRQLRALQKFQKLMTQLLEGDE
ncbi:MAG: sigma-70 family RNA polymerase sigma factor [Pirellulales bacterium]